ncbi:MAG: o-succinylbenzoate synthase [Bacteroidales bacterium]|nr:o-succinylbenzoate synthase [Bacteroidales bacterium]
MIRATFIKHILRFISPAGTSRGVLAEKDSWFVKLTDPVDPSITGIGECSILPGLSYDYSGDFESRLESVCRMISRGELPVDAPLPDHPSIRFGLETALRDLRTGGKRLLFSTPFTDGRAGIPTNGLIWMGTKQSMLDQIAEKIEQGFRVIKMKVGALRFEDELEILHSVRGRFDRSDLEIRLDANGAWKPGEALDRLHRLEDFGIHSVEQPIRQGNVAEMSRLCEASPVDIALDEELIGISALRSKRELLESVGPDYIVLKPGLLGGFAFAEEWIGLARELGIGWWITSALESNIGLNAVAQWTASLQITLPQGLGTGHLFFNNIPAPLEMRRDQLWYNPEGHWDLSRII